MLLKSWRLRDKFVNSELSGVVFVVRQLRFLIILKK